MTIRLTSPLSWVVGIVGRWRRRRAPQSEEVSHDPNRPPGLDCPECRARITVTIPLLLADSPVRCQACGLELRVDREESRECLERLAELQTAIDHANAVANTHQP